MSEIDPLDKVVAKLLEQWHEEVNAQVRALLEQFGIDPDRVLEAAEIGLDTPELKEARSLIHRVFGDLNPLMDSRRMPNGDVQLTIRTNPERRHNTPIVNGVVSSECSTCGAKFHYGTQTWDKKECG